MMLSSKVKLTKLSNLNVHDMKTLTHDNACGFNDNYKEVYALTISSDIFKGILREADFSLNVK